VGGGCLVAIPLLKMAGSSSAAHLQRRWSFPFGRELSVVRAIVVSTMGAALLTSATRQFGATLSGEHGAVMNGQPVTWYRSDDTAATMDVTDLAIAAEADAVTIAGATSRGFGTASVTVSAPPVLQRLEPDRWQIERLRVRIDILNGDLIAGAHFVEAGGVRPIVWRAGSTSRGNSIGIHLEGQLDYLQLPGHNPGHDWAGITGYTCRFLPFVRRRILS
jgi:hypothetical protein